MEHLVTDLIRQVQKKYYGKYRGSVTDNQDPEKRGRLRLRVPSVLGDTETDWALPCFPFGGLMNQGWFFVPEPEAQVWVEFEEGELSQPLWTGTFWQQAGDAPEEADKDEPTTRVLRTPGGHVLQFDDEKGEEMFRLYHPSEAGMVIDKNGTITLTDAQGSHVTLDAEAGELVIEDANGNSLKMTASGTTVEDSNGNKIEMAAASITVKGQQVVIEGSSVLLAGQGGEPIIKGQSFLTLFATHMHPTAMGPSGPPIPQGEMSTLSSKVMSL